MASDYANTVGSDYANTKQYNLSTDLNVTPYYDDYVDTKEYYRILYKPGFAVQGRELTQMQTILQKQIARFGRHVFEEGTVVIPGNFQLFANNISSTGGLNYVKIRDVDDTNTTVSLSNFDGVLLKGLTSNVKAYVNMVADGTENSALTKTLYIDYGPVGPENPSQKKFIDGETLVSNVGNLIVVATNATGKGSVFRISEGVVFSKEHFVYFPTQEVILDRYSDNPTAKVGFNIIENIVDYTLDSSLLDPALESSNYSAPGADRLKISAVLESRDFDDASNLPNFSTLFTIKEGVIQIYNQRTQYSLIKNELAKRTFDESGDYYVSGLDIEMRENLDTGTNGGINPIGSGAAANLISVRVSPGTAYVKGYEVGVVYPRYLTTPKSTTYANVSTQIVSASMGSYVTVNEMTGHLELDEGTTISLVDRYAKRLTNGIYDGTATGNIIGSASVMSIEYNSGTLGTVDGRADIYLADIRMLGSNAFSSVRSLFIDNSGGLADFGADIIPDVNSNTAILREPFNNPLLYYTGSNFTRKIGNKSDLPVTRYYYTTTLPVTISTSGTFTVSAPGSDTLPYTGTLSTTDKRELFLNLEQTINVALKGTCSNGDNADANVVTISGSAPLSSFLTLNKGENVQFSGQSNTYTILEVLSATQLKLAEDVINGKLSTNTMFRHYGKGSYIDLTSLSSNTEHSGVVRSVTGTGGAGGTLAVNLYEPFPTTASASISFRAAKTTAKEASKVLKPNRYVKINCLTSSASTSGPYYLGFSDVYRIKSIVKKTGSDPTSNTDGTIVTSQFIFDNGQRDTHYDIARITPKSALSSTDRLLVELDYFDPDFSQGKGFFSIDSYPINDELSSDTTISTAEIPVYVSKSSGKKYDLRNYIDFRPVRTITATDTTSPGSAAVNPGRSNTFNFTSSSMGLISPSSEVQFDYSYYMARKDILTLNKEKVLSITQGQPGTIPITPKISENELGIAELTIAPYPSISPYYAKIIGKQELASSSRKIAPIRQTMRDLGVMKERITNLEYYASLSLLEKSATDMLIQDEKGNNRFKNGIFVDTFRSHELGETTNPDYRIVVDPDEQSIRPLYSMHTIGYNYLKGTNVRQTGDIVTLDYTEVPYANVTHPTATITTEKSSYSFVGNMTLTPENDIWIDTITLPPNVVALEGALQGELPEGAQQVGGTTTTWNAWQKHVTGYKVYKGVGKNKTLSGSYATYEEALEAAKKLRTTSSGASIETLYLDERTGSEVFTYGGGQEYSLGTKVVNTEIVPYIRPQIIRGKVTGLKPYAEFRLFFDNINMTDYTRPTTLAEYEAPEDQTSWTYGITDSLLADGEGNLWFRLSLPNTNNLRFTVGSKTVKVTDSMTNTDEESSYAQKTFFAQGTIQTKQDTILSTQITDVDVKPLYDSETESEWKTLPPLPNKDTGGGTGPEGPVCCFISNAVVSMADGSKKAICDIKIGDNVLSKNGTSIVTDIIITDLGNRELYGFAGHEPFATEDHPFLTNKGWSSYKIGDYHNHLVRDNVENINWDPMTREEEILHTSGFIPVKEIVTQKDRIDTKVYALTLNEDSDHTYWVEDFLTHNKSNNPAGSHNCLAYVLPIKVPSNEEGIFLTSVDIFCAEKHPTLGMWCEVRELDAGGGITRNAAPFSDVWFTNAEVPISTDGITNALKVTFRSPIFLYANKSYAFIIHPEAKNPNYYFWISRIGQNDVNTGQPVTTRAGLGTLFTTNNDAIWALQDQIDLVCNWYRASFTVGSGTFEIGNVPKENLKLTDIIGSMEGYGEPFASGDIITMNNFGTNGSPVVGDFVIGVDSAVNASVINITGSNYHMSNVRFISGEKATVLFANGTSRATNVTITSKTRGVGFLEYYQDSPTSTQMILTDSNGKFSVGKKIFDISDEGEATIQSVDNLRYSVIDFEPTVITFTRTGIAYEMAVYSNATPATASGYFNFDAGENYVFDEEKAIYSRSNEIVNLSSAYSNNVRITLSTSSDYLTPVFDMMRTQSIIVDNLINSDTTGEADTQGGLLYNKYISKIVTLADYQDAEDINVFLTAYRPPRTDVKVWIKLLNGEDSDTMAQKTWVEMDKVFGGDTIYSSIAIKTDFKEFKYILPDSVLNDLKIYEATNSQGITFTGFKSFQIKIGLLSDNSAVVPRVADLRTIALQV